MYGCFLGVAGCVYLCVSISWAVLSLGCLTFGGSVVGFECGVSLYVCFLAIGIY